MSQIEYVDGTASTNGNGLTPTTPRQKLQDAVMHATGADNRPYVRVAATSYDENVSVSNGAVISIVGADGAIVSPSSNDAVSAFNGASMTIRNLIVTAANGNGGNCQNASFTAYRSQFIKSKQSGVYSLNCDLNIDATWLDSNGEGGIYIGGGNFQVTNSIITRNVSSGGLYQLASGATTTFVNNTVADNSAGGSVGGVFCSTMSSLVLRNSIFASNAGGGGTGVVETNCPTSSSASDDPTGGPQSAVDLTTMPPGFKRSTPTTADSYHLLPTSPCVNNASLVYAPNHDFDFETRPDPTTMQPDIGADEVE